MSKFKYCLIQYLAWLVDNRKKKKILDCKDCPLQNGCKKKEGTHADKVNEVANESTRSEN